MHVYVRKKSRIKKIVYLCFIFIYYIEYLKTLDSSRLFKHSKNLPEHLLLCSVVTGGVGTLSLLLSGATHNKMDTPSSIETRAGRTGISRWALCATYFMSFFLLVSTASSVSDDYGQSLARDREHQAIVNVTFLDPLTGVYNNDGNEFGRFGSESRLDSEWGIVVHIRTIDNRTDGCTSPPVNAPSERWIALIERGSCNFQQKIHNAAIVSNASAVVIYNHQDDTDLLRMKHTGMM